MMRRVVACILTAVMALPMAANAFTNALSHVTDPVAAPSLLFLKQLVSAENYRQLGFHSVAEAQQATLGDALIIRSVRLDRLRAYQPSADPVTLLEPPHSVLYPVLVASDTRCGITLGDAPQGWTPVTYGLPHLSRQWIVARANAMHDAALPGSAFFGVRIPALNANFLSYYDEQNRLMLASIATDRSLGVAKSKFMPASQMFAVLVPVAQRFNEMSN